MNALILRRGMDGDYYRFMRIIADANGVELIVDRRNGDRRHGVRPNGVERRVTDRRGEPPATWPDEGFIAIGRQDPIEESPAPAPSPPNYSPLPK